ncbi:FeoA family protein [Methylocystis parvus]|uniref:FeoA family protein n=1 Tax=Methylocystis parvus TaxID=134 RepID=UPI003C768558
MKPATPIRSLDQIGPGENVVLQSLRADRELQGRLMQLGLFVGAAVDIVQSRAGGPMLLRVRNTLVAIGHEEAKAILVDIPK